MIDAPIEVLVANRGFVRAKMGRLFQQLELHFLIRFGAYVYVLGEGLAGEPYRPAGAPRDGAPAARRAVSQTVSGPSERGGGVALRSAEGAP